MTAHRMLLEVIIITNSFNAHIWTSNIQQIHAGKNEQKKYLICNFHQIKLFKNCECTKAKLH